MGIVDFGGGRNALNKSNLYENYNNIKIMLIFWFSCIGCIIIVPLFLMGVHECVHLGRIWENISDNCDGMWKEIKDFAETFKRFN